jgi:hypothetical protein
MSASPKENPILAIAFTGTGRLSVMAQTTNGVKP